MKSTEPNGDKNILAGSDLNAAIRAAFQMAGAGTLELADMVTLAERMNAADQKEQTISLYRSWLEQTRSPLAYVACFNLAILLAEKKDFVLTERMYRQALALKSDFIQAYLNLGSCLERQGRADEALAQWRTVLELGNINEPANKSLHLHALNNLGRLLEEKKRYREALEMLNRSLAIEPKQRDVLLHLVYLRQRMCIWPVYVLPAGLTLEEMIQDTSPLAGLAAFDDPALQLETARRFVDYKYPAEAVPPLAPSGGYRHDRIRIGYLSSDFCNHPVSMLTVELFELHNRQEFDVYGFCWSREDNSPLRARVIAAMDHFIRIESMSDREAAEAIRAHEIDILVDLHGLTSGARPLILSYRPAPVQLTYLGFPGATGLPWIDYVVADRYLVPEETRRHFSEKPLYMPQVFQISDSKRAVGPDPTRTDNSLPDGAFVFCSFNNNYKFTPEVFASWMRILRRVPDSVLWLLADNEWARENLCNEAERQGVAKERLIFAPRVAPANYLARYRLADLFLDTYPFNGGTTANDALWMGLPLLTCSGQTFAARMAGSLLTSLDLPELVTSSLEDYEERAVRLASEPERLAAIRARILASRATGSLFAIPTLVADYETLVKQALRQEVASAAPAASIFPKPPLLTILMMAVKKAFFVEAIYSVLSQTFGDFKLIVSDNTEQALILNEFKDRIKDPRIHWTHAWPSTQGEMTRHVHYLLDFVDTKYFKIMHDDDILYQLSNSHLVSILESNPNVVCAFHGRHIIDDHGRLLYLKHWLQTGVVEAYDERTIAEMTCRTLANLFGEVPFSMYRSSILTVGWSAEIDGWPLSYLGDISSVLNMSRLGHIAGSGAILGAYRKNELQVSMGASPIRLSGLVESEVLLRILNARYHFGKETIDIAVGKQLEIYNRHVEQFPILEGFIKNLDCSHQNGALVPDRAFFDLWIESRRQQNQPVVDFPGSRDS